MIFKKQGWLKNAKATPRGFVHARTGEMLKRVGLSEADIAEWNGEAAPKHVVVEIEETVETEVVEMEEPKPRKSAMSAWKKQGEDDL